MKLKNMILTSLLIAIGLVLHQITPPIAGGMRPDFLLSMMFIAVFLNKTKKNAFLAGTLAGIFSAMTTTFPGGQLASFFDKIIAAFVVLFLTKVFSHLNHRISVVLASIIGTIVSGVVFLAVALLIVGSLPMAFATLVMTVVLPATIINAVATYICYNVVYSAKKAIN